MECMYGRYVSWGQLFSVRADDYIDDSAFSHSFNSSGYARRVYEVQHILAKPYFSDRIVWVPVHGEIRTHDIRIMLHDRFYDGPQRRVRVFSARPEIHLLGDCIPQCQFAVQ